MSRLKVYVSGPISNGDVEQNVRNACKTAAELIKLGYAPLVPQLTAYLQSPVASLSAGFSHETWMEVDLPWVEVADVVLRLPGLSRGADREVEHAKVKGIPVFFSIEEMQQKYGKLPVTVEEEWKVGDRFTCGCGGNYCTGKEFTVDRLDGKVVFADRVIFSPSHIKRIPPSPAPPLPKGGSVTAPPRKAQPVATGVLDYFPDALKAVAHCSYVGNEQHNPGQALHWNRELSTDEADAMIRHFLERGKIDTDGVRHSAKVAWRSLALLQKEIEGACVS